MVYRKKLEKATLLLASTLTIMAGATIAAALPEIKETFEHIPHAEFWSKMVLTVPSIFVVLFAPLAGYLVDKVGRKIVLLTAMILYAVGGSSGIYVDSIWALLAGRAILGCAVAGSMTTVITLVGDYFKGSERKSFMGLQSAFITFGGVLFILTGGFLADISWRAPFYVYLSSLTVFPCVILFLNEPKIRKNEEGAAAEIKNIPKKIYLLYLIAFLAVAIYFIVPIQLPFLLSGIDKTNNFRVGVAISTSTLFACFGGLTYARISRLIKYSHFYMATFLLMSIGYFIVSRSHTYEHIMIGLVFSGFGFGLCLPNTNAWLVALAPEELRGRLVGGLTTAVFLGQFVSPVISEPIVNAAGMNAVFGFGSAFLFLIFIALFVTRGSRFSS